MPVGGTQEDPPIMIYDATPEDAIRMTTNAAVNGDGDSPNAPEAAEEEDAMEEEEEDGGYDDGDGAAGEPELPYAAAEAETEINDYAAARRSARRYVP